MSIGQSIVGSLVRIFVSFRISLNCSTFDHRRCSVSFDTASLTLRSLLQKAASRGGLGRGASDRPKSLSGLTPTAQAFAAAVFASDKPLALVVPSDADVDNTTADVRFFLAALESLTRSGVNQTVLPFPSQEVDPYRGIAPHLDVASSRARALAALAQRRARLVIASVAALLPRLSPPSRMRDAVIELGVGVTMSPTDLADRLADAGFAGADPVEAHGEFCVRGGVADIFQAGDVDPIRAEFAGDSIESLRRFDPTTQRSIASWCYLYATSSKRRLMIRRQSTGALPFKTMFTTLVHNSS